MSWSEHIEVEREGGLVHVWLNRPDRHNALMPDMWQRLRHLGAKLLSDDEVRVAVVGGRGESFCSGIDRRALSDGVLTPFGFTGEEADRDRTSYEERDIEAAQESCRWMAEADFVTIAAVRGFALGAGAQIAMSCDIRVVGDDTTFALPEVELGLFPEMAAVAALPPMIGYDRALELALTGRRVDAAEAERIGLATTLVAADDVHETAAALATKIAAARPDAITYCKRAMRLGAAGDYDGALRTSRAGGLALLRAGLETCWER